MATRYLIINADDYGYGSERDSGILECFHDNCITNVSLMVNGINAKEAASKAQTAGLPMGLHLNLTEGLPVSESPYTTIIGPDGFFLGKQGFRTAIETGKASIKEVEREIESQIEKFEQLTGRVPVSVDGHQHAHVIPDVCQVFASIMKKKGIKFTRLPLEDNYTLHSTGPTSNLPEFLSSLKQNTLEARNVFTVYGIKFPGFSGLYTMGTDMSIENLQICIQKAFENQSKQKRSEADCTSDGIWNSSNLFVELMVHPGYRTGNVGGCGDGPDDFSQSSDREHEMKILKDPRMKEFYNKESISLVSFKDLL